jgi:Flp pilus assembly protein CpaB
MSYSVRNIAIALVLGIVATALVIAYTGSVRSEVAGQQATTTVLVATGDIAAGTSVGDAVAHGQIAQREVVRKDAIVGALTVLGQLSDRSRIAQGPIAAGQQLTQAAFATPAQTGIRVRLKGALRAEQISLDRNAILGGTLHAGDHVDLVGTFQVPGAADKEQWVSRIIVRDIEVLATDGDGAGSTPPSTILAVPDSVVPKINFTLQAGDLYLVLRPDQGASDSTDLVADTCRVLVDGLNAAQRRSIPECQGAPE